MNMMLEWIKVIRFSSREMVRELGLLAKVEPYELSLSFRHVLIELESHGSLSHVELSELLRLNKSTISRMVKKLIDLKLIATFENEADQRFKQLYLTSNGKKTLAKINALADRQVNDALLQLTDAEKETIASAMTLYAKALKRARIQNEYIVRSIIKSDNSDMMAIIKKVLKEYGADRPGFAFVDPELENLHRAFHTNKSGYFVIERKSDKKIVGGAGFGMLAGSDSSICELKKMYLLPEIRGLGLGSHLLKIIFSHAQKSGYKKCYLETLNSMENANYLYQKSGFTPLINPLGNTGHFGCDKWYLKELDADAEFSR